MKNLRVTLTVNGSRRELDVEVRQTLLDTLRDQLNLLGGHGACEQGSCGACTVIVEGEAVLACLSLAVQADNKAVTTVEGIGSPRELHPVQRALTDQHGLQCGYCTPGMVMSGVDLLRRNPEPTDYEIEVGLSGNICRCTGYVPIVSAIRQAARDMCGQTTNGG